MILIVQIATIVVVVYTMYSLRSVTRNLSSKIEANTARLHAMTMEMQENTARLQALHIEMEATITRLAQVWNIPIEKLQ